MYTTTYNYVLKNANTSVYPCIDMHGGKPKPNEVQQSIEAQTGTFAQQFCPSFRTVSCS